MFKSILKYIFTSVFGYSHYYFYLKYFAPEGVVPVAMLNGGDIGVIIARRTNKSLATSVFGFPATYAEETKHADWEPHIAESGETAIEQLKAYFGIDVNIQNLVPLHSQKYTAEVGGDKAPVTHAFFAYTVTQKDINNIIAQGGDVAEWGVVPIKYFDEMTENTNSLIKQAESSTGSGTIIEKVNSLFQKNPTLSLLLPAYCKAAEEAVARATILPVNIPDNKIYGKGWDPFN